MEGHSEFDPIFKQIKKDEEYLNLYCFIVSKRLIVIDDIEFKGYNHHKNDFPFIPFEEIRYISWVLNNIGYRVFLT